jgi:hypothetical protein
MNNTYFIKLYYIMVIASLTIINTMQSNAWHPKTGIEIIPQK